jgi:hypothetical protein
MYATLPCLPTALASNSPCCRPADVVNANISDNLCAGAGINAIVDCHDGYTGGRCLTHDRYNALRVTWREQDHINMLRHELLYDRDLGGKIAVPALNVEPNAELAGSRAGSFDQVRIERDRRVPNHQTDFLLSFSGERIWICGRNTSGNERGNGNPDRLAGKKFLHSVSSHVGSQR